MATKVIMPQLGESVVEGTVTRWLRKAGQTIQEFEPLVEIYTDKVDTEIPSPVSGLVRAVLVPEGATVRAGTILAWIGQPDEVIPEPVGVMPVGTDVAGMDKNRNGEGDPLSVPAVGRDRDLGFISPVVARLAHEQKIDLRQIAGSGEGGRITKKDVLDFVERQKTHGMSAIPAWEAPGEGDLFRPSEIIFPPAIGLSTQPSGSTVPVFPHSAASGGKHAGDQLVPLNSLRKAIAEHMLMSKHTSAHVTTVMEANLQRVVAQREAQKQQFSKVGARLTYTAFFAAAAVNALKALPMVNSSWSAEGILVHPAIQIGIAVSLGSDGLIVPVIKNADALSLLGLARAINDLSERARSHRLQPDEVKGGTFTITNHGTSGSLFATPIINQPECAILGVGAIQKRVIVIEDAIAIRPMVYLSLTFDHRILDGAAADAFLAQVVRVLEEWPA